MKKGGSELRDWESSAPRHVNSKTIDLLGLKWNKSEDILSINLKWLKEVNIEIITKRTMLSATHKAFDPFRFVSPVTLCPKLMLQKTWKLSLRWDEEIIESLREEFVQWFRELEALKEVRVPRWINIQLRNSSYTPFVMQPFPILYWKLMIKKA
ncbi:hypothetical protein AVEN_244523-1 [Araneus ventricosus]|uniref:Reverse transcriptase domain-containing protein n=1 Tax=Araneus ventricosus TaxID=182803 RepID=A0A4Y2F4F0_ARAVE|nr:hypothetical protein AVEN_244523-1 [Araneus ventricosus]